jgi:pimeloyl-ACP methyl ester carboxylesterase
MHTAAIDGRTLSWREVGTGAPVVLLHGIGSNAASWAAQMQAFPGHRVLAWNAPGYGASEPLAKEAPDAGDYARVLRSWLDHLGLARINLLGHSLGCLMAARFAADHPERVSSLTLASIAAGHARLPVDDRARMLAGRIGDVETLGPRGMAEKRGPRLLGPKASPEQIAAVVDAMGAVDPFGYAQAARMLSTGDILADLARLPESMPVQIVFGGADLITTPEANRKVAAIIPRAPVTEIPDAGHALSVDAPAPFNAAIAAFLRT